MSNLFSSAPPLSDLRLDVQNLKTRIGYAMQFRPGPLREEEKAVVAQLVKELEELKQSLESKL